MFLPTFQLEQGDCSWRRWPFDLRMQRNGDQSMYLFRVLNQYSWKHIATSIEWTSTLLRRKHDIFANFRRKCFVETGFCLVFTPFWLFVALTESKSTLQLDDTSNCFMIGLLIPWNYFFHTEHNILLLFWSWHTQGIFISMHSITNVNDSGKWVSLVSIF